MSACLATLAPGDQSTASTQPARVGRPRILDAAKQREIIALVSAGSGLAEAARYVQISVDTIRREAQRDDDFGTRLRTAELTSRMRPLAILNEAASAHWRAAAWMLERTMPERYARKPAKKGLSRRALARLAGDVAKILAREGISQDAQDRIGAGLIDAVADATHTRLVRLPAPPARRNADAIAETVAPADASPAPVYGAVEAESVEIETPFVESTARAEPSDSSPNAPAPDSPSPAASSFDRPAPLPPSTFAETQRPAHSQNAKLRPRNRRRFADAPTLLREKLYGAPRRLAG